MLTGYTEREVKALRGVGGRPQGCLGGWGAIALCELPRQRQPASDVVATLQICGPFTFCVLWFYLSMGEPIKGEAGFFLSDEGWKMAH